ncbi:hypothetical protein PAU_01377 [Photorhabdus asymbiotica]|uniref:Uncharacterized protein n=1 Tax=Photorhabdus asymbiotica subsp. asymbiotica (strain ATCC 43949 / 3105-77) TaxID=553480 RepID=C7BSG6_PHOAA|nr:hypothetical protein PAU_01377 [Photorhabdus asymbiotica]
MYNNTRYWDIVFGFILLNYPHDYSLSFIFLMLWLFLSVNICRTVRDNNCVLILQGDKYNGEIVILC